MLINLLNVITAIICIILLKEYFSIFFEKKREKVNKKFFWGVFFIWQIGGVIYSSIPLYIKLTISVFLVLAISVSYYTGDLWFKFVVSILICTVWTLFEYFVGALFILVGLNFYILKISGAVISEILTLSFIFILKKYFKNKIMRQLPAYYYVLMMLVPVGGIYLVYNIFYLSSIARSSQAIVKSLVGFFIILAINIVIFKIYLLLGKQNELEKENILYSQQLVAFEKYYRDREQLHEDFRRIRHDYKHHFSILCELMKKKEYLQTQEYLDNIIANGRSKDSFIIRTDNLVIDSLINSKLTPLTETDIELVTDIHVPTQLPFELGDIGILLGNIIDNAVEAVESDISNKKFIRIFIKYETKMLLITCINSYTGELTTNSNGDIITAKKDSYYHGFGLSSIRKVADKYHGAVVIEDGKGIFKIKVVMYACDRK